MITAPTFPLKGPEKANAALDRTIHTAPVADTEVSATDAAVLSSDFETFLTLLTAQMRNQDPLNPTESTEFVAQLANFSAVEQQIRSNEVLEDILGALSGGQDIVALAEWIGREVRFASSASFDGTPLEIETTPVPLADAAVLVVRNDQGEIVQVRAVDPSQRFVTWEGQQSDGTDAPDGDYTFSVEYHAEGELISSEPGRVFVSVREVRMDGDTAILVAADGTEIPLSEVTAIREGAPD
ncbi:flagellar hook capping FlgD N-terminal domain-containing protein [Algicella marina]|uniref:Basal-body rod modification protein FlgD n=1 Tax=Algicella marina TaxID=2683284 RepID=A0A6P1T4L0_9RHOB|nr:flagellar hook capping FlgD N-terminal domain-containing protein [Algicella marina]QHQ36436.1 flagellin biosynthesis protein FlgD [Algicella marina]